MDKETMLKNMVPVIVGPISDCDDILCYDHYSGLYFTVSKDAIVELIESFVKEKFKEAIKDNKWGF